MSGKDKDDTPEPQADPNAWMTTFADLVMLLLTFFVLLLTMKSMDSGKARELSLNAEGPLDYIVRQEPDVNELESMHFINPVAVTSSEVLDMAIELLEGVEPMPEKDRPVTRLRDLIADTTEDARGVTISFEADELFGSGQAEIRPDRLYILDAIARLFRYATNDILVMGHSDNVPLTGDHFASNLELSVWRALNVLHYLTDGQGIKPERLASGGYGDLLPRYPNDSPESRTKNRRVEFVLRKPI